MLPRPRTRAPLYILIGLTLTVLAVTATLLLIDDQLKATYRPLPGPYGACYTDISDQCQTTTREHCPPPGERASRGGYCESWLDEQCQAPDACQAKIVSATATATGTCGNREKLEQECLTKAHNQTAKLCTIKAGPNCGAQQKGACAKSEPPANQTPTPSPSAACNVECTVISLCVPTPSTTPVRTPT